MTTVNADPDLTARFHELMPFCATLGLEMVEATPELVVGRAEWTPDRCTAGGAIHGGFLMAVVDSCGGACAALNLPDGALGTSTIESKTNFVGAVRGGTVTVRSAPVHIGGSTIVIQTDVVDDTGKLISRSMQTQAVLRPRS